MGFKNHRSHKDANHKEIVEHLLAHGTWVHDASAAGTITDLIVDKNGIGFLEIKISGSKAKWYRTQLTFMAFCPAPVGIAKDKESALEFARNPADKGLTAKQKQNLAVFLQFNPAKYFQPSEIEKVLNI